MFDKSNIYDIIPNCHLVFFWQNSTNYLVYKSYNILCAKGRTTMENIIRQQKIQYLKNYTSTLQRGMTDRVDDNITLWYAVRNVLVSQKPLKECMEYQSLNQYFESQAEVYGEEKQADIELLHVLSCMVTMMSKGQDSKVASIIPYYALLESAQAKSGYQKSCYRERSAI